AFGAAPDDGQVAAPGRDPHRRIEQATPDAGDHGGASPRAAGQRFAGTALIDPQLDGVAIDDLHEAGVDPLRKAFVVFDQRPVLGDRCAVDAIDNLHGMRVAHRNDADGERFVGDIEVVDHDVIVVQERNFTRLKAGDAHVDRHAAIGLEARRDDAGLGLDADFTLVGQPGLVHETHETASTVATLLDLAAIGIEDAIAEIDAGLARFFNQQDLVATDAEMAVTQVAQLFRGQRNVLADAVEDNEIVAQAMHFREFQFHTLLRLIIKKG